MAGAKVLFGTLVIVNTILVMFLVAELQGVARKVDELGASLPSRADLAMLRPLNIRKTLDRNCATCHSERIYAKTYGRPRAGLRSFLESHRKLEGGEIITEDQVDPALAALIAVRCTACHDESVIGMVSLMPRTKRADFFSAKVLQVRPLFRFDEVRDLGFAFDVLLGEEIDGPGGEHR